MAKFKFAFESLKKFRENRLLLARRDMAVVEAQLTELQDRHRDSIEARGRLLDERNASENLMNVRFLMGLVQGETVRMRKLESEIAKVEEEFLRHKSWVTHLGRELKVIEKLEEKQRAKFEAEMKRREEKRLDAWASESWARKINSGSSQGVR